MNISDTATQTGLSSKTIRYYESISLVPAPGRRANGYREYEDKDIKRLKFLRQARHFGFSIDECRLLLDLYQNPLRKSAEVHELVEKKLLDVDRRINELQTMRDLLGELVAACPNDQEPDCAIIDSMAGTQNATNINPDSSPVRHSES